MVVDFEALFEDHFDAIYGYLARRVGPDIARGWGKRRTVAEDFLYDSPVLLGSVRIGPDLADVGARPYDANWHLRHLYAPQLEVKGSTMPPFRFLFETRRIEKSRSPDALPDDIAPRPPGYEVVPTAEAKSLVGYLLSLDKSHALKEVKSAAPEVAAK